MNYEAMIAMKSIICLFFYFGQIAFPAIGVLVTMVVGIIGMQYSADLSVKPQGGEMGGGGASFAESSRASGSACRASCAVFVGAVSCGSIEVSVGGGEQGWGWGWG